MAGNGLAHPLPVFHWELYLEFYLETTGLGKAIKGLVSEWVDGGTGGIREERNAGTTDQLICWQTSGLEYSLRDIFTNKKTNAAWDL